jgi:hypothetical protein
MTIISSGDLELTVFRAIEVPTAVAKVPEVFVLTGTWPGQGTPAPLASARSI